jgi:hypothetical protein
VGGVDFCNLTAAAFDAATASDGVCASCDADTGTPAGCAAACPACVNAAEDYFASCAGSFDALNYNVLLAYASRLAAGSDCSRWVSVASRPYAAALCGAAFDHLVQYVQSAASHAVVVGKDGTMTTPYSCLLANTTSCPQECQADLDLLAQACHAEDDVPWSGNGLPGFLTAAGAPAGAVVTPLDAFQLLANGTASVPSNLQHGVSSAVPLPLELSRCGNATGIYPLYSPPPPNPPPPSPAPSPPPPPDLAGDAAQAAYVADVASLGAYAAAGLASSAAAELNDPGSSLSANATAAAELRSQLLSAIAGPASNASSPAELLAVAGAVSQLVSNAAQLSAQGATAALDVLLAVASAGSARGVATDSATGSAVATSLSSLVSAALLPGSALNSGGTTGVLSVVMVVIDALAESVQTSLAPGAQPVDISSPAIQMRMQADTAPLGPDSRLFTTPLTAVGSTSAIAPLPSTLFASSDSGATTRSSGAASGVVRAQFASTTFDPYTSAAAASGVTGITRLVLTDASGSVIEVANLSTPIFMTIPLASLADGFKAQCQYWDTSREEYSTQARAAAALRRLVRH